MYFPKKLPNLSPSTIESVILHLFTRKLKVGHATHQKTSFGVEEGGSFRMNPVLVANFFLSDWLFFEVVKRGTRLYVPGTFFGRLPPVRLGPLLPSFFFTTIHFAPPPHQGCTLVVKTPTKRFLVINGINGIGVSEKKIRSDQRDQRDRS